MSSISEIFGSLVFNDRVMRERLPKETYKALRKTMGDRKGRDAFYPLVPANDGHHCREAR